MPDLPISDLTQDTTPATTDEIVVQRGGTSNFRCTLAEAATAVGVVANPVTAASVIGDNAVVRGDGGARGVQTSTTTLSDTGTLAIPSGGDVTINSQSVLRAGSTITDNRIIRGDGGSYGAQESAVTLDDSGNLTGLGTLNSHPIPGVGASAETGTTRSASSTDDNKVTQCSNAAGCTVSVNTGTAAGTWRAYWASTAGQQVTLAKGTLTTLYIAPTYNLGSDTCASLEEECVVGVYYLSTSVGIAFGIMAAA